MVICFVRFFSISTDYIISATHLVEDLETQAWRIESCMKQGNYQGRL